MRFALLLPVLLAVTAPRAQQQPQTLCQTDAANGLDFWVGTWDLSWNGANGPGSGTNVITRDLGGCVIHERFEDATGFAGQSVSVYTPSGWRQTWVDNSGGYLLFEGQTHADGTVREMRMAPFQTVSGAMQINRMIWEDVTNDSLTWRWQSTTDDGETWRDNWVIRYQRRTE
ncbi:MAG: hypothetical protein AAF791_03410 [Bacteroidota bacterium]